MNDVITDKERLMSRLVSALFLSLATFLTHAADVAEIPAVPEVSVWPLIVSVILFVAMIGGFFGYVWMKERDKPQESDPS
jgi:membrane protease YdiL (CAAX protease family)